jgi:hypothetical protein
MSTWTMYFNRSMWLMEGVIYCSIQQTGAEALEDLALAERMILPQVSDQDDAGDQLFDHSLIKVERLLRLTFNCFTPKSGYKQEDENGLKYINPPTVSNDYDDAYHEARRIFLEMFGEEAFLVSNPADEADVESEAD